MSISILEEQQKGHIEELNRLRDLLEMQEQFTPKVKHLLDNYEINSVEANNAILKEVVNHVLYEKNERNTRGKTDNCNFALRIYPNVPF